MSENQGGGLCRRKEDKIQREKIPKKDEGKREREVWVENIAEAITEAEILSL